MTFPHPLLCLPVMYRVLAIFAMAGLAACGSAPSAPAIVGGESASTPAPAPIKIGIALGGGAAKGFAHIGVLKILEANGFAPAVVAGTSAGSVVGAMYASGMPVAQLQEKALALEEASIRDLQWSATGLVLGQKLEDYVNEQVGRKPLEQLAKPFVAVATRLEDGEAIVFARGNTGQAVRASSSVPGVFQPVTIGRYHYVDGGIVSPVPVDAARQLGADVVVAVDISSKASGKAPSDLLGTLGQSITIMGQKLGQAELARADIIIRPKVLDLASMDFSQRNQAIVEGERAAMAAIAQIRERVVQWRTERDGALRQAQQQAAQERQQNCLNQRSRLQVWAGKVGLDDSCPPP